MEIDYAEWRAGEAARRAAIEPFMVGAEHIVRSKPRAATEADFLRRRGVPRRLIGPIVEPDRPTEG